MAEPHIRRLSLFDYASLAVSKVIYFGDSETDHVSMPALIQAADLPRLLVYAIHNINSQAEVTRSLGIKTTAIAIETMQKKVSLLIEGGVLPVYDPHIFLRIDLGQIAPNRDDYLVRLDDVLDWLRVQGVELGHSVNGIENNGGEEAKNAASGTPDARNRWPWGGHHTELLGHLEAAARRYWGENYVPADATTAPINATVSEWLQTERKVSRTMADSIASILRPDGLPTGPRK